MNKTLISAMLLCATSAFAHFGVVLPSNSTIDDQSNATQKIVYKFNHPFENEMMDMQKPKVAGVFTAGKKQNFTNLVEKKEGEFRYHEATYEIKEPGVYQFFVDPAPYFEPAEDTFIRHISKTVVNAYGFGEGWDEPIGLKAEIVPLTRPYGLYKGNIFTGVVMYKGEPAKGVIVEVEYYNDKGKVKAPGEDFITQEVKTNERGEFSFVMPLAGWWGFAALIEDDETIKKDGKEYPVEIGGVIWVETKEYK
ncbi:DUF4198 domain-containing protein [Campylobacter sp. RM13119]|uniref:DUF4198 domain-containing protein n=1 Tax=Campylobacter californiensis TaxID=1032243 RepID=UPI00147557E2|nr:DUF4198 domain-containing protein [Campylobacter sp. RM13119]MBE3606996.1 DUF4198 domain-containing protein [Campylobacter sp. RM13119]